MFLTDKINTIRSEDISFSDYMKKFARTNFNGPDMNGHSRDVLRSWNSVGESDGVESNRSVTHSGKSLEILNMRNGGTRGSDPDGWKRPEDNFSLMGSKNVNVVEDDMHKIGKNIKSSLRNEVIATMGNNAIVGTTQSPLTAQKQRLNRVTRHNRISNDTKNIFKDHMGSNLYTTNPTIQHNSTMKDKLIGDSLGTQSSRFRSGDQSNVNDNASVMNHKYNPKMGTTSTIFQQMLGAELQIEKYSTIAAASKLPTGQLVGGGQLTKTKNDQQFTDAMQHQVRKSLIQDIAMRVSAKHNPSQHDSDFINSRTGLLYTTSTDSDKNISRNTMEDQQRSEDNNNSIIYSVSKMVNTGKLTRYKVGQTTDNEYLTNVANRSRKPKVVDNSVSALSQTIGDSEYSAETQSVSYTGAHKSADQNKITQRSHREITAPTVIHHSNVPTKLIEPSDKTKIVRYKHNQMIANDYAPISSQRSILPTNFMGLQKSDMSVIPSNMANRTMQTYSAAAFVQPSTFIASIKENTDQDVFSTSVLAAPVYTEANQKWRSATMGQSTQSTSAKQMFGSNYSTATPGIIMGSKHLRVTKNTLSNKLPDYGIPDM